MRIRAKIADNFSPYLDPAPFADFYDDFARRGSTSIALALLLNFVLFGLLFSNATLPRTDINEPDIIPIQIIQIAAPEPESLSEPEPTLPAFVPEPQLRPAVPNPPTIQEPVLSAPPPPPPPAAPEPVPPQPAPIAEPEPQPIIAPAPEILAAPQLDPIDIAPLPEPVTTIAEPELRPVEIELFDPVPPVNIGPAVQPDPIIEPLPEPIPEPIIEPLPQSIGLAVSQDIPDLEPISQPIAEPVLEPLREPLPEPIQIGPSIDGLDLPNDPITIDPLPPAPIIQAPEPEQIIEEAAPGTIGAPLPPEPVQELILPAPEPIIEPLPDIAPEPLQIGPSLDDNQEDDEPDFVDPPVNAPEEEDDEDEELVETQPQRPVGRNDAPLILADDDAPETDRERGRAVPQNQADTGNRADGSNELIPNRGGNNGGGGSYRTPTFNGGSATPGLPSSTTPPPGGVSRPGLGRNGWTLGAGAQGDRSTTGLSGVELDMRCREAGRTHEECPEYIRQLEGRGADGFESLGTHRNSEIGGRGLVNPNGNSSGRLSDGRVGASTANPAIGGGLSTSSAPGGGWTSETRGLPSTSVIDDADFGRTFRNTPLGTGTDEGARLRDLFDGQELNLPEESLDPNAAGQAEETDSQWSIKELPQ